jgi:hypothetical protein
VFANIKIEGGKDDVRAPYTVKFIQDKILASGMFNDLDAEASSKDRVQHRRALFVMVETGCRPSEIVNLPPERIRLDPAPPDQAGRPLDEDRHRAPGHPAGRRRLAATQLQPKASRGTGTNPLRSQIAKDTGLTRQTVYWIKDDPVGAEVALSMWGYERQLTPR